MVRSRTEQSFVTWIGKLHQRLDVTLIIIPRNTTFDPVRPKGCRESCLKLAFAYIVITIPTAGELQTHKWLANYFRLSSNSCSCRGMGCLASIWRWK